MNKEIDWEICKEKRIAKSIQPDYSLIKYLHDSSIDRAKTAKIIPINETTKESIISLLYDALRELLEAFAIKNGYKIYNHECYTHFLRVVIQDENFALEFDSLRLLRNKINYYGKKITINDAASTITNIEKLINKARNLLKNRVEEGE